MHTQEHNTQLTYLSTLYNPDLLSLLTPHELSDLYNNSQPHRVKIGDLASKPVTSFLVNSVDGFVPVNEWRNKGSKDCVTLITSSGKSVTASIDHFFEMDTGKWKYANTITPGEYVVTQDGHERVVSITDAGTQETFDFYINHKNHRYYTNGISSHNSGAGKSLFLANLGVNFALTGLNVVYLTLELSEALVSMRIDSMLTGISTRNIFKDLDDVEMKVKIIGKKSGMLQVKYMPSGKTSNDVRAYLKEFEIKTGKKVDVLLVDYLDLLMPIGKKISAENLFIKDKYVSEELRNLAMEKQCVFVTAAQLNRCLALDTKVEVNGELINIVDVKVGDHLTSNAEPVKITEVLPITKQPVYEITLKSGKKIKCSANHKFPTLSGLKTLNTGLTIGDKLQTIFNELDGNWDEIVSIEYVGVEDTIDINVTGNRLFYANGILTHNSAVDEGEFDHSHISGGLSKIQTADNVFGIFTSRAMRERGRYQLQLMKTRSSSGVGQKIDLAFDIDTLRITDIPEDERDDTNTNSTGTSSVIDSIKRKTNVTTVADPSEGAPVGKIKSNVQSSKLRDILNSINRPDDF